MGPLLQFKGVLFRERGSKKGGTKPKENECFFRLLTLNIGRTRQTLCRHFGTFWATEKTWARIKTAESRMFVW